MEKVKIVIAGNHREFMDYLRIVPEEARKIYKEASHPDQIRGLIADEVITVGTWYERSDAKEMEREALSRVR